MTRFEKDAEAIKKSTIAAHEILETRKAELERLDRAGRACKNGFRRQCIAQEYAKLCREYNDLDAMV